MPLFILKNPNPQTLLARVDTEVCPPGYEPSTAEAADAFVADAIAAGWTSAPLPSPPPSPPAPTIWTALEFMRRFTQSERLAIITAGRTDAAVEDIRSQLAASNEVISDDPSLVAGLIYLVSKGLLTPERKTAILTL
jgi:hypothetical protein